MKHQVSALLVDLEQKDKELQQEKEALLEKTFEIVLQAEKEEQLNEVRKQFIFFISFFIFFFFSLKRVQLLPSLRNQQIVKNNPML